MQISPIQNSPHSAPTIGTKVLAKPPSVSAVLRLDDFQTAPLPSVMPASDDIVIRAAPTSPKSPAEESRRTTEVFGRSRLDAAELPEPQVKTPPEPQVLPVPSDHLRHHGDSWETAVPAGIALQLRAAQLSLESTGLTEMPTPPVTEDMNEDNVQKITTTTTVVSRTAALAAEQPLTEAEFVLKTIPKYQSDSILKQPELISEAEKLKSLETAAESLLHRGESKTKKSPGGGKFSDDCRISGCFHSFTCGYGHVSTRHLFH